MDGERQPSSSLSSSGADKKKLTDKDKRRSLLWHGFDRFSRKLRREPPRSTGGSPVATRHQPVHRTNFKKILFELLTSRQYQFDFGLKTWQPHLAWTKTLQRLLMPRIIMVRARHSLSAGGVLRPLLSKYAIEYNTVTVVFCGTLDSIRNSVSIGNIGPRTLTVMSQAQYNDRLHGGKKDLPMPRDPIASSPNLAAEHNLQFHQHGDVSYCELPSEADRLKHAQKARECYTQPVPPTVPVSKPPVSPRTSNGDTPRTPAIFSTKVCSEGEEAVSNERGWQAAAYLITLIRTI
uniref:Protein phosphatase methylesterase-1 n=1 Tax=Heterorhabditis bacteriophora TaxID=37862 RepID=A0A1I7WD18_HETBA